MSIKMEIYLRKCLLKQLYLTGKDISKLQLDDNTYDFVKFLRLAYLEKLSRPKFLPYKYISLYRKIYYDDVMDYLDKRSRGIPRDIPHAETWAERLVRTCRNKAEYDKIFRKVIIQDKTLVEKTKYSGNYYYHHNKNLFNKHFSPLLY